jgi:predicted SprT family Zn-dependent metalloprotease
MQNIKNRALITDTRILTLIAECVQKTKAMGFVVPTTLRFLECKAARRAGLACYQDTTIILSTFIYKEEDNAIKSVIYHELGHIIAGPLAKHGPIWLRVVNKMSATTGLKISRCYNDKDMPVHAEEKKALWKYNFQCTKCKCQVHYLKRTDFVNTYNAIMSNGKPRWTCAHCGGTFELIK